MRGFTQSQIEALLTIPMFTGALSLVASITIIYIILHSFTKLSTTYHRIVFALAILDVLQSSGIAIQTLPVPKESGLLFAMGNQWTCNIQGFVVLFAVVASPFYFSGLMGYFLLAIKFEWSDDDIVKYYEPFVHCVSILCGLTASIVTSIHHGGFYTSGNICWIAPKPYNCYRLPHVVCEVATDFRKLQWIFIGGPTIFCFCVVAVSMLIIIRTFCTQNDTVQISMGSPTSPSTNDLSNSAVQGNEVQTATFLTPLGEPTIPRTPTERRPSVIELYAASKKKKKTSKAERDRKDGMIQALLYIVTFILTYIFFFVLLLAFSYPILIMTKIFFPAHGFMFFLVFIRLRVVNVLREKPSYSIWKAFIKAVQYRGENPRTSRSRRRSIPKLNTNIERKLSLCSAVPQGNEERRDSVMMNTNLINDEDTNTRRVLFPIPSISSGDAEEQKEERLETTSDDKDKEDDVSEERKDE